MFICTTECECDSDSETETEYTCKITPHLAANNIHLDPYSAYDSSVSLQSFLCLYLADLDENFMWQNSHW